MFIGGSTVNLDAKGRLAFPTRYRAELMERCDGRVVLTVDENRCLSLYPWPDWEELQRTLVGMYNQDRRVRNLQRILLGHATELELDKNGRVLIPPRLREFAGLDKRVVLTGLGNKFEIWNEEAWDRLCGDWVEEGNSAGDLPDSFSRLKR
ncbi:MAG: division/cell wall cluster transcriptional repressor MraZ [Thiohalobacterales bacterium]|nr:division/cell wall cluster transcriptional repressor MraZ [Thiohalobacterales bacterium]